MELEVRKVTSLRDAISDLHVMGTPDDDSYAQVCGHDSLHDALHDSAKYSKLLLGVYWEGMCVGLVGVNDRTVLDEDDKCAQVWVHTADTIRNRPTSVLPALAVVMSYIESEFPDYDLYVFYRDEDSIGKLASYAGFTKSAIEHDVHGIKHILAWR